MRTLGRSRTCAHTKNVTCPIPKTTAGQLTKVR
nr:MAG TPA: Protein of unknown function (DUF1684) [Caudoviricetes sp.]